MKRGWAIRRRGFWDSQQAVDAVVLGNAERYRRRIRMTGERGTDILLDLDEVVALRDGDGIMLDDGHIVLVTSRAEPLAELAPAAGIAMIRLAWHLGNRHTDLQIVEDRIRIRRDHVIEALASRLGASVEAISAPFDPEQPPVFDGNHDE